MTTQLEPEFKKQSVDDIIIDAIENHEREELWCLYTGGKDSSKTTHYVAKNYPKYFKGVICSITGTGVKEQRYHVIEQCKRWGWPLTFTWPRMPDENGNGGERPIDTILKRGFGGNGNHRIWMATTKYYGWRRHIKERLDHNPALISGVRKKESNVRNTQKVYSQVPIDWDGFMCFVKPILYENGVKVWDYVLENDLKVSPVSDILGFSGDSLCGCHAEKYELELIKQMGEEGLKKGIKNGYYYAYDYIKWAEKMIAKKLEWLKQVIPTTTGEELAELQKQQYYLSTYNTWSHGPTTEEQDQQMILADFVERDVCGESCNVP